MPHTICIRVAGTVFRFRRTDEITIGARAADFQVDTTDADWLCCFEPAQSLAVSGKSIYKDTLLENYDTPKGKLLRKYFDPVDGGSEVAVVCADAASKTVIARCSEKTYQRFFQSVEHCMDFAGIEWILMQEGRMFLHASCIDTPLGGILFTGPSGIGKSTQATLWGRYRNAELVNGDKTILVKDDDVWYGWGSPYAGSSNCFRNRQVKVRAIVVLKQAEYCSIGRLEQKSAFRELFSQLTVNSWNREFMECAVDFASALTAEVPVYRLACTPTQDAVEMLWSELEKAGDDHG